MLIWDNEELQYTNYKMMDLSQLYKTTIIKKNGQISGLTTFLLH